MNSSQRPNSSSRRLHDIDTARSLGENILKPVAHEVDGDARFPNEALEAIRKERLLGAYIPESYGGRGCSIDDMVAINEALSRHCGSTGLIYAMHQSQVACLVHHARSSKFLEQYLRDVADNQVLLASITSESGVGGDIGKSITAVEENRGRLELRKETPTISYGEYAGGFLATARRSPKAESNDQVLILLQQETTHLEKTGTWDTMGMRGTCSPSFRVRSEFSRKHIFPLAFSEISARTLTPMSHILWAACWLGIAADAVARASALTRVRARSQGGTRSGDNRLAEVVSLLQAMRTNVNECAREYEEHNAFYGPGNSPLKMGLLIKINNLKTASSELAIKIVSQTLAICGMAGYSYNSPYSVARHLRDAYSAGLMVSNDRIYAANAAMLLLLNDV